MKVGNCLWGELCKADLNYFGSAVRHFDVVRDLNHNNTFARLWNECEVEGLWMWGLSFGELRYLVTPICEMPINILDLYWYFLFITVPCSCRTMLGFAMLGF